MKLPLVSRKSFERLEADLNRKLQEEIERLGLKVDDFLARVAKVSVGEKQDAYINVSVAVPESFVRTLMGESTDLGMYVCNRIGKQVGRALVEQAQAQNKAKGPQAATLPVQQGTYL